MLSPVAPNLLYSLIGARRRNDESLTHAAARLGADMNYSGSAVSRALKTGRVSEKMFGALIDREKKEKSSIRLTTYFGTRLMGSAKGKRLKDIQRQAIKQSGKFRKRASDYRKRTVRREKKIKKKNRSGIPNEFFFEGITPVG